MGWGGGVFLWVLDPKGSGSLPCPQFRGTLWAEVPSLITFPTVFHWRPRETFITLAIFTICRSNLKHAKREKIFIDFFSGRKNPTFKPSQ